MSANNSITGRFGEKIAVNYLENLGYKIIHKNYKCRFGEIDLIAAGKEEIIFIEVKTRKNLNYGYPFEVVTDSKLEKIRQTSQHFLLNNVCDYKNNCCLRFDVISIMLSDELADAVLAEDEANPMIISKLKKNVDYSLEHIQDI